MGFLESYNDFIQTNMEKVFSENREAIEQAAQLLFEADTKGHRIYTFGTGHSHMVGQDSYGRAGGFAKIYPILEVELTLATHPVKSTYIERTIEYADVLENMYDVQAGDVVIATSNSGRNKLVIEYISRLKEKGIKVIVITSLKHSKTIESRHPSGKRLFELGDVVLDNFAPYGDAGVAIDELTRMGPISTMSGCFLSHSVIGRFVEMLRQQGLEAPVFRSSNMDGADEYNRKLFDTYFFM